ncbi:MAG: DbpA RNA binding domain-containing protein, partial [Planctomycetales bacterium]
IEVGRTHQVKTGNIVGAIANEAGIGNESIGKIQIFDQHSTVDLPRDFPHDLLELLQNVFVAGRKLQISRMDGSAPRSTNFQSGKHRVNKSKFKPKTSPAK